MSLLEECVSDREDYFNFSRISATFSRIRSILEILALF